MYSPGHPASSGSYDYEVNPPRERYYDPKGLTGGPGYFERIKQEPLPIIPDLPENPTEQQRAEHAAACSEHGRIRFKNVGWEWVPDPQPQKKPKEKPKSLAATDRERLPMLPLPRRTSKLPKINVHRHEAQCSVCRHPDRQIIEDEFVNWASPRATAKNFGIDFRALYRHARVYNLIALRNRNIRGVLSLVLERAEHIATPTADAIIRGVKAFTRVNDDGEWIEPPSRVIFSTADSNLHPQTDPEGVVDIPQNGMENVVSSSLKSIPRHAARIGLSQLTENTHRRLRYPETHFAVHHSRKIKTKAKRKCAR